MQIYLAQRQGGTREITELITTATWSGDKAAITRKLTFTLFHEEGADRPVPQEGDGVTLEGESGVLFSGWVVKTSQSSESVTMDATAMDGGMYLKANDGTYLFRGAAAEDIAAAVCADHGYPVKALAATGVPLDRKFPDTRLDRIIRTAYSLASEQTGERYAIRMTPEGLEVKVLDQSGGSINLRPRSNLMEATTTRSIENMCNSVGIYDEYGTRLTSIQDQEAIALYGLMERHVRQGEDEGRSQAAALLEDGALQQTVSVQVLGDERLITGETVVVEEPETGLQGIFWIDADSHTWARGQYTCRLTLNCRSVMATAGAGSEL